MKRPAARAPRSPDGSGRRPGAAPLPLDKIKLPRASRSRSTPRRPERALDGARLRTARSSSATATNERLRRRRSRSRQRADEVIKIADGLRSPTASRSRTARSTSPRSAAILRYDGVLEFVNKPPPRAPAQAHRVIDEAAARRTRTAGSTSRSARTGSCISDRRAVQRLRRGDPYGAIVRMKADGTRFRDFARGVRNTVGFDWHPETQELWFTDNGRDNLGDNAPPDELNHAPRSRACTSAFRTATAAPFPIPEFGGERPVRRLHAAGAEARSARRGARHEVLHRHMFPRRIPQADLHRRTRILEPHRRRSAIGSGACAGRQVVRYEPFPKVGSRAASWGRPVDVLELADGRCWFRTTQRARSIGFHTRANSELPNKIKIKLPKNTKHLSRTVSNLPGASCLRDTPS